MLKGIVNFEAAIKGNGISFPSFDFNLTEPGVDKVEIEAPNGDVIRLRVYFAAVASHDRAKELAAKVSVAALNRIAFHHQVVIVNDRITSLSLSSATDSDADGARMAASATLVMVTEASRLVLGYPTAEPVKSQLEQISPPGEHNYALFRSAMQATGTVKEFMILYNVLLQILGDNQPAVDAFILKEDPGVPVTPSRNPRNPSVMETVYTRLRNEIGHRRPGVKLETTRAEMASRVAGLRALTKRAIELHP
jgi:hypothetical protein